MPERTRLGLVPAISSCLVLVCTSAYAQTDTTAEPSNNSRLIVTLVERFSTFGDLSLCSRMNVDPRPWELRRVDARRGRWSAIQESRAALAQRRSRKKMVLIGVAIGGAVGVGGGIYASKATGGDTDPWGVPGFAGIGAAVGAACGFLISLF